MFPHFSTGMLYLVCSFLDRAKQSDARRAGEHKMSKTKDEEIMGVRLRIS